ncbi:hypothetical protein [Streptomyces sp. NPDC059761]|uniref:hypothetical protein n=1 Tax=Streptomyces sp. NPDC059761 TaxID=3346937 RepID=UPI00364B9D41
MPRKRKTATPRRDSFKSELISLILVIASLSIGAVLVITGAATTTEAAGLIVTVLAAIGWGARGGGRT